MNICFEVKYSWICKSLLYRASAWKRRLNFLMQGKWQWCLCTHTVGIQTSARRLGRHIYSCPSVFDCTFNTQYRIVSYRIVSYRPKLRGMLVCWWWCAGSRCSSPFIASVSASCRWRRFSTVSQTTQNTASTKSSRRSYSSASRRRV